MEDNKNMNELENKALSKEELEAVSGGFTFEQNVGWLNGKEIKCPVCGCDTYGDQGIKRLSHMTADSYDRVVFVCYNCRSQFEYRVGIISRRKCTAIEVKVNIRNGVDVE